jgi:hypothetical protein
MPVEGAATLVAARSVGIVHDGDWHQSADHCQSATAWITAGELLLYLTRKAEFDQERAAHLSRGRGGL